MTSNGAVIGNRGQVNCRAAKVGIVGLSKAIALDMATCGKRLQPARAFRRICCIDRLNPPITWGNWRHGEDRRYQAIRARNQLNFGFKSLYLMFALQAVLAWTVSAPFLPGMAAMQPLGVIDFAGTALALFGLFFEAIGDAQMARFKAGPASKGQVKDRGLWRYTATPTTSARPASGGACGSSPSAARAEAGPAAWFRRCS